MIQPSRRARARSDKGAASLDERFLERSGDQDGGENAPSDERQSFGQGPATWMSVRVSERGTSATLTQLAPGGDTDLTPSDIAQALTEHYNIEHGIDEEAIVAVLGRALTKPHSVMKCNQVIARATSAIPGDDGRLEWSKGLSEERLTEAFRVHAAIRQQPLEAVMKSDARGIIVAPDQVLARIHPPTPGKPGRNLFGEELNVSGRQAPIEAGAHVRIEEDAVIAEAYGYLGLNDNELSIAPALWLSADAMRAVYIHLELLAKPPLPTPEMVHAMIAQAGVSQGTDDRAVEKLCSKRLSPRRKRYLTLARGSKAMNGEDTRIEYTFDPEKRAGTILPDGSIDFRERNLVIGVAEDQQLATVHPATEGLKGYTIFGEELPATDGTEYVYKAGENVRAEGDPPTAFYATVEGNAHVAGDTLHVKPLYVISGDVDYETGNIDTPIDVQIAGTVRSGFTVESGGTITIGGSIEPGATVVAQGDVIVAQGIVGEHTNVVARGLISMGTVQCKFIQNAAVLAKEGIEIGSYIFNAQVRCGGQIAVHTGGGKRGGSIVGGEVFAAQSIQATQIGSSTTAGTIIGLNADPVSAIKLAKLRKQLRELDVSIDRQLHSLGVDSIDVERLKNLIRQAPNARKAMISEAVDKLYEMAELREKVNTDMEPLIEKNAEVAEGATIEIAGTVHSGVEIDIGDAIFMVSKEIKRSAFYLEEEHVAHRSI